jgi:hypothetical protein
MDVNLDVVQGIPSALTAIREFHRLKLRRERSEALTLREARLLVTMRNLFEPRVERDVADRERLMIAARRRAVLRARGSSFPAVVVGLGLRVVHVHVECALEPGEWVRIGIPRRPDRRWHRFHGRVLRVDRGAKRASIALVAPAGVSPNTRPARGASLDGHRSQRGGDTRTVG